MVLGGRHITPNKIKTALIDTMLPPYRIPLYNELNRFPDIDLTVMLSSLREKDRSWHISEEKIQFPYKVLPGLNIPIRTRASRMNLYHFHFNPSIISALASGYDCVILSGYASLTNQVALWLSKLLRIPVILWYRSFGTSKSIFRKLANPLVKGNIRLSDAYIVPGSKAKNYLISMGADPGKIYTIGNPVDNEEFMRFNKEYSRVGVNEIKEELGIKAEKVILYVGRLIEAKGVQYLLKAFSLVNKDFKNVELLIVGDGYYRDQLLSIVRKNNIENVSFRGFAQITQLTKFYFVADVLVLPSLYEPWGLVINEAMNFGLPIITTEGVGAAGELVQDGKNGYIVKPGDVTSLYIALRKIIRDYKLAIKLGKESLKMIRFHTPKRSADILHQAILNTSSKRKN